METRPTIQTVSKLLIQLHQEAIRAAAAQVIAELNIGRMNLSELGRRKALSFVFTSDGRDPNANSWRIVEFILGCDDSAVRASSEVLYRAIHEECGLNLDEHLNIMAEAIATVSIARELTSRGLDGASFVAGAKSQLWEYDGFGPGYESSLAPPSSSNVPCY